jgi:hypothetical protein
MRQPLVAARGLHHHPDGAAATEPLDQLGNPGRIVGNAKMPLSASNMNVEPSLADVHADHHPARFLHHFHAPSLPCLRS